MEKVRGDFQTLYQREKTPPPGPSLSTHNEPIKVNEDIPSEAEVEAAVRRLHPHRTGGHTHLRAEYSKKWQQEAYPMEQLKTPLWREQWICLVDLVQHMWSMVEIPQELGWMVLVLNPKGNTCTRGIGLLDTIWKVVEALINTHLRASLQMHYVLHGLRSGRGTGAAIMVLKLAQELASIDQEPLFLVFLDLRNAYDTVDQDRLLIPMEWYGAGRRMCELLDIFWDCQ